MSAKSLRAWGREALKGHVGVSLALCLVGSLIAGGMDFFSVFADIGTQTTTTTGTVDLVSYGMLPMQMMSMLFSMVITLAINGVVSLGISLYFINLTAHRPAAFKDLFSGFRIFFKGVRMNLAISGLVFLWTLAGVLPMSLISMLLLVACDMSSISMIIMLLAITLGAIPGMIAGYRYAMTPCIIAEFPDISVLDAMRESKRLMQGNKRRMVYLELTFLGWSILNIFTLGIGSLWLTPYMQATNAAFYLDVTGRAGLRNAEP